VSRYKNDEYRNKHAIYMREHNKKNPGKATERSKRWAEKHPGKYRLTQKSSGLKKHYGITLEERDLILHSQNDRCAICRTDDPGKKDWCVDHCHTTKRIRGVLCHFCNSVLGYAKDDTVVLKAAIAYLKRGLLI
jgi:hypothetical protein